MPSIGFDLHHVPAASSPEFAQTRLPSEIQVGFAGSCLPQIERNPGTDNSFNKIITNKIITTSALIITCNMPSRARSINILPLLD